MEYQHILINDTPEGVRTITLNRPERLNAFNGRLGEEVPAAVASASADDNVRVVVITGAGRGFCAGLDLQESAPSRLNGLRDVPRHQRLDEIGWVGNNALQISQCDKPVIAAINGAAAGAGLALALACDIRIVAANAKVTTGYARRGLSPDGGITYFLPRLVGLARATELILSARDIEADEAERIGMASLVFPADGFSDKVADYAKNLAKGAPLAFTYAKRLLAATYDNTLINQLRNEILYIRRGFESEDTKEAIQSFLEKRQPEFKGK
jgi:2-(1,2-epoxy-1,2-dihydrophenyl)acetyl-CoA isomerase